MPPWLDFAGARVPAYLRAESAVADVVDEFRRDTGVVASVD